MGHDKMLSRQSYRWLEKKFMRFVRICISILLVLESIEFNLTVIDLGNKRKRNVFQLTTFVDPFVSQSITFQRIL